MPFSFVRVLHYTTTAQNNKLHSWSGIDFIAFLPRAAGQMRLLQLQGSDRELSRYT